MRGPSFCTIFLFAFSIFSSSAVVFIYLTHPLFNPDKDVTAAAAAAGGNRTLYEILNVSPTASDAELKRAYRHQARKLHPDKHHALPVEEQASATDQFDILKSAYEFLTSDDDRRCEYDHNVLGISSAVEYASCKIKKSNQRLERAKARVEALRAERRREEDEKARLQREANPVVNERLWGFGSGSGPVPVMGTSQWPWSNPAAEPEPEPEPATTSWGWGWGSGGGTKADGEKSSWHREAGHCERQRKAMELVRNWRKKVAAWLDVESWLESVFIRYLEFLEFVDWLKDATCRHLFA
jgi:uncharacterized protein YecT (DUF1311 family)